MDEELRALERRWQESGLEADRHAWLCAKLRHGWDAELRSDIDGLERAIDLAFAQEDLVVYERRFGFDSSLRSPKQRLMAFSENPVWQDVEDPEAMIRTVLDVQGNVRLLHPDYDTSDIGWRFLSLFRGGFFWTNFSLGRDGSCRGVSPIVEPPQDWWYSESRAIGATLGPLVGFFELCSRDTT